MPTMEEEPTEDDLKEFEEITKEAERSLYYSIGRAITAWAKTEGMLVIIAAMLLETTTKKAGLVLYSILNINQWLAIIDELFVLDERYTPLRSDWLDIAKHMRKLNDTRVRLAHHSVVRGKGIEVLIEDGDVMDTLPSLKPSEYDVRSKSRSYPPLTITELGEFAQELSSVTDKIVSLLDCMYPIHGEQQKRLSDQIKRIKEQVKALRDGKAAAPKSSSSSELGILGDERASKTGTLRDKTGQAPG
jgi:hypothetical protein